MFTSETAQFGPHRSPGAANETAFESALPDRRHVPFGTDGCGKDGGRVFVGTPLGDVLAFG